MDYFIFGDVDTRNYGVYIFDSKTDNAPARIYDRYDVPGRNGDLLIDRQKYENVEHVYWGVIYENYEENLSNFRAAMRAQIGYKHLKDSIHTDEFYSACFMSLLEVTTAKRRNMGKFQIVFTRKPQRFLLSGEETITYPPGQPGTHGKNLLPYPYKQTSKTVGGITFTDNGDGTITVNGTATVNTTFILQGWTIADGAIPLDTSKRYILSGCPEGGSASTYVLIARAYAEGVTPSSSSGDMIRDTGNGIAFDQPYSYVSLYIGVISGTTINNLTFKPMLKLASDIDPTWEPYYDGATTIINPTLYASNPIIRVTGSGTVTIGDEVIAVSSGYSYVDINSEIQDCYCGLQNANSAVTFQNGKFPQLKPGISGIASTGISSVQITPKWYRL